MLKFFIIMHEIRSNPCHFRCFFISATAYTRLTPHSNIAWYWMLILEHLLYVCVNEHGVRPIPDTSISIDPSLDMLLSKDSFNTSEISVWANSLYQSHLTCCTLYYTCTCPTVILLLHVDQWMMSFFSGYSQDVFLMFPGFLLPLLPSDFSLEVKKW